MDKTKKDPKAHYGELLKTSFTKLKKLIPKKHK